MLMLEMQTVLFEAANLCYERMLGVYKEVPGDGTYFLLTSNFLLMGISICTNSNPCINLQQFFLCLPFKFPEG